MHWSDAYIGRPYVLGESDCANIVCDVHCDVFNQTLPDDIEKDRGASVYARFVQLKDGIEEYADPTDSPVEGDIVLMMCKGRPTHVGVYCIVDNEAAVLHAMRNANMVVRHRIRDLSRVNLFVEGYYKWKQ